MLTYKYSEATASDGFVQIPTDKLAPSGAPCAHPGPATSSHKSVTFTDAPDGKDVEDDVTPPDNLQCSDFFVQSIDNNELDVAGNDAMKLLHFSEIAPVEYATRSETLPAEVFDSEDVPLPDNFSQISNNIDIPKIKSLTMIFWPLTF